MKFTLPKASNTLLTSAIVVGLLTVINPFEKIDLLIIGIYLLIIGHIFLREKMLLVFLAVRPLLDIWRDSVLLTYHQTTLNFNAGFSLLVLAWGGFMLLSRLPKAWKVPGAILATILFLLMGGSALYSIAPLTSLVEGMKFFVIILLFILSYLFIFEEKIAVKEVLLAVALSAIAPLLFGISQLALGEGISTFGIHGRIYGTFAHPNVFAFFVMTLLFIHIEYAYINRHKFWKTRMPERHLLTGLLLLLLIMTFTRGAWVGMAIFLFVIGVFKYRKMLFWFTGTIIAFYTLFFPLDLLVRQYTDTSLQKIQIIERLTARNEDADSIQWRFDLVEETIPLIAMRPKLGYGYGTFEAVWGDNRNLIHLWDDSAEAHNDYLRFGLELGIIGLVLYGMFLLSLLWRSVQYYRVEQKEKGLSHISLHLMAFLSAFIAVSITDNMLHHTPVMWLMFIWLGAMFGTLAKEIRTEHPHFLS